MAPAENVACLVGVAALIQRVDGKVLLGLRPVEKVWAGFGGKLQSTELPEEGLRRELQEELGLTVRTMSPLGFSWGETPSGKKFTVLYFHVMLPPGSEPQLKEETAASQLAWFDLIQLPDEMWPRERAILDRLNIQASFISDAEIAQAMSSARGGVMLRDGSTSFRIARAVERIVAPRAANAALESAAREFDRRAAPGCGFYEPDEPAAILRALPASLGANKPASAGPSVKALLAWLYAERYSEGLGAWMRENGFSKSADSLTLADFEEVMLAQITKAPV